MKKITIILLAATLCLALFSGCSAKSENKSAYEEDKLAPTEAVDPETLLPSEDFLGTYQNEEYTLTAVINENDEMVITITSAIHEGVGYEWVCQGYFSDENYRVNYTDGLKYKIAYDNAGTEQSRETVYDYGAGRIQFSDTDHLLWKNNVEDIEENTEFTRIETE